MSFSIKLFYLAILIFTSFSSLPVFPHVHAPSPQGWCRRDLTDVSDEGSRGKRLQ